MGEGLWKEFSMVPCCECGQPVYGQPLMHKGAPFCSQVCRADHAVVAGDVKVEELVAVADGMGPDA